MAGLNLDHLNEKMENQNQDYWMHIQADTKLDKYPAKQHARAVATKLGVSHGHLVLAGERATLLKDSDQLVPFRQRRYFYYLSGCNESDCYVVYDIRSDVLTLFIPKVDLRHAVWGGAGSTRAEAYAKYDVDVVEYTDDLSRQMDILLRSGNNGKVYVLDSMFRSDPAWLTWDITCKFATSDKVDDTQLKSAVELCRIIKFPHEIELIRRANDISAKAHRAVLENIRDFKNERQVEGLFLDTCISAGAHNQAYSIIAGAGSNAAVLHYVANDAPFADSQLLLIDAGAEFDCYASDVTRTFPISGYWTDEAKAIYDAVTDMQAQCISRIAPGVHFRDLQILSMAIATKWLLKLGILYNGSLAQILKAGTTRAFFPHGLGHHVGLEVHDVLHIPIQSKEDGSSIRKTTSSFFANTLLDPVHDDFLEDLNDVLVDSTFSPKVEVDGPVLEPGMVITVEPGLYFSAFALSKVYLRDPQHAKFINKEVLAKYMPVGGVRIEDDILVTKGGYENLTTAPKGDEALKIIRGESSAILTRPSSSAATKFSPVSNTHVSPANKENCKSPLRTPAKLMDAGDSCSNSVASKSSQLSADLAAKCSIDVKEKGRDCLPPRTETQSLFGSFPYTKSSQGNDTSSLESGSILGQIPHPIDVHHAFRNLYPDLWEKVLSTKGQVEAMLQQQNILLPSNSAPSTINLTQVLDESSKSSGTSHAAGHSEVPATAVNRPNSSRPAGLESTPPVRDPVSTEPNGESSPSVPTISPPYFLVRALYDFDEPNDRATMKFRKGDILEVRARSQNGWWLGVHRRTKITGWVPENYVERVSPPISIGTSDPQTSSGPVASEDANSAAADANQMAEMRSALACDRLLTVFSKKLADVLFASDSLDSSRLKPLILDQLTNRSSESALCFSGLCMHLKQVHGPIDFGNLQGSGIDKFKHLYMQVDEALKAEFEPGHLFHRLAQAEKEGLCRRRWDIIGVREQQEHVGICGTCRVCRDGFQHWDEKWLTNTSEEEGGDDRSEV